MGIPCVEHRRMGCLIALVALLSPRLALILLAIFGEILDRAYDSWVIPVIGFFLLPWTTLVYALFWEWGPGRHVTVIEWIFVVLALFADLGSYTSGRRYQASRV